MTTLMTRTFRDRCVDCQVGQGRKCHCRDAEDDQSQGLEFSLQFRILVTLVGAIAASAGLVWLANKAMEVFS